MTEKIKNLEEDVDALSSTIIKIIQRLRSYFWVFFASIVFCLALGFLYYVYTPKTYTASALVKPGYKASLMGRVSGLPMLAGFSKENQSSNDIYYFEEHFLRLASDTFLTYFIEQNDILKVLYFDQWDDDTHQWIEPEKAPTIANGVGFLKSSIAFGFTNPVTHRTLPEIMRSMQFKFEQVDYSASILNDLIAQYNEYFKSLLIRKIELKIKQYEQLLQEEEYLETRKVILAQLSLEKMNLAHIRYQEDAALSIVEKAYPKKGSRSPKYKRILVLSIIMGFALGFLLSTFLKMRKTATR